MVIGIDNVMKLFSEAKMPYYKLYEGHEMKPANTIAESDGHESVTDFTSNEQKVRDILNMLAPGKYLLSAREKFNSNQSGVNIRFDIPYAGATGGSVTAAIGSLPANNPALAGWIHPAEHKATIERLEFQQQMKDMERKMEEMLKKKEPKQSAIDKFMETHGNTVLPAIIGLLTHRFAPNAPQVGLAGWNDGVKQVPPTTEKQQPDQQLLIQHKLNYVLSEAKRMEGDNMEAGIDLLLKVVTWRKNNETTYETLLKPILNSVDISTINLNSLPNENS